MGAQKNPFSKIGHLGYMEFGKRTADTEKTEQKMGVLNEDPHLNKIIAGSQARPDCFGYVIVYGRVNIVPVVYAQNHF